ncbi:single-stranded DNA-binding protein [Motilibacter aurantiacus]|uniref:single-stranded DNA-binding protein n=1 Tax=Motilibacter aurantiacus TaxID=2714955 RepID=UPI00140BEFEB|nr:single-stranded DNA-binding protein [Motilibacter aurantiacus]NHC45168.1 single-stranded DNA-binding protein [Motilibacter aurantiacus]
MNDTTVTLRGNVATDPRAGTTDKGTPAADFRLAANERRQAPDGTWVDGETSYYTVRCFRALALNAAACLAKGDPVVVTGTLRVRQWSSGERSGTAVEIDATSLGHDLVRGTSTFARTARAARDEAGAVPAAAASAGGEASAGEGVQRELAAAGAA